MDGKELTGERLKQARSLFESALEVSRDQRSDFLSRECGDDTELRRFVERLLESHESGEDFFLHPPADADVLSEDLTIRLQSPRIGTKFGPYEITDKLGEGGMGTVWKGWDSLLQRPVAIKFVSDRLGTSEQAHRRFLREARAASKLSHQGIATVHSAGERENQVYIVFRLIDGETVSERVKRGPLEVSEALRLAREAAEALGHAHEAGVLHRDVTSRNLMVDRDGSAVIVDFGLALPEADPRITKTGSMFGTLGYMAPEVIQGKPHDRRSDLYGLAVVLYEMLTGTLPFEGERAESLLYAIVNEPVEAPSARRKDLPKDVDRVLLKVLAKDPAVRYQTTGELAADLRRLEAGAAPTADVTPEQSGTRLWETKEGTKRPWLRRPLLAWILGAVATLAIAYLAYVIWSRPPAETEPIKLAVLPLQNNSDQPEASDYMAVGLSEALAARLGRVSALRVTPWITSQSYRPMQPLPLTDIADELGVNQLVVGTFRHQEGQVEVRLSYVDGKSGMQNWAEEFQGSENELLDISQRIATSVAQRVRGELDPEESETLASNPTENEEAYKLYLQGAAYLREGTQVSSNLALSFFEKAVFLDPKLAEAHVGIGAVQGTRYWRGWGGSLELAEASYRTALVLNPQLWAAHRGLSRVYWHKGRFDECLQISALAAHADPDDIQALLTRAEGLGQGGLWDVTLPLLKNIIDLDPANPEAYLYVVYAMRLSGRPEATIEAAEEYFRRFGEEAEIYSYLGDAHLFLGDSDDARLAYERAFELEGRMPSSSELWGWLEQNSGHSDRARAIWTQSIKELERSFEQNQGSDPAGDLATLYIFLGDTERAEEVIRRLQVPSPAFGFIPIAYALEGNTSEAIAILRREIAAGHLVLTFPFFQEWEAMGDLRSEPAYPELKQEYLALKNRLLSQFAPSLEGS